jgi:uncharacterized membrane protein (DUF485 family)
VSLIQAIKSDPTFQALVSKRTRFSWALTTAMLAIYFGFIGVVAFVPQWLGTFVSGATTIGIPVGLAVIAAAFALTGLYVYRANSEFDRMTRQIIEKVK